LTDSTLFGILSLFSTKNNDGAETVRVGYKVWLDNDGKAFGDGPYELLKRVDETHSLHRAAKEMGMAYSKAWRLIQTLEERLGFALLEKKTGGLFGGGSQVTPKGKVLMNHYKGFRKDAEKGLEKIYRKHFDDIERKGWK